ncbi:MAG: rod shape-determining protein MreD [Tissierellia bacterium]|nr:rod shape-determining protein MreD [Tissierellia bacterium]
MKQIKKILFLMLILIFQYSFVPIIKMTGIKINIFIVLLTFIALRFGRYTATLYALIFGIFTDVLFSFSFGIYTLIYFLLAISLSFTREYFNTGNLLSSIIFTALATIIYNLLFAIMLYFLSYNINFLLLINRVFSSEIIFNIILAIIIYILEPKLKPRRLLITNLRIGKADETA